MEKKILDILKRIYSYKNSEYDLDLDVMKYTIPGTVTKKELIDLENVGLRPNNVEIFKHDELPNRFIAIREHKSLTLKFVSNLFINSLTSDFLRGRQSLMSYCYAKHVEKHLFYCQNIHLNPKYVCHICAIPQQTIIDKTDWLYTWYLGNAWNENPTLFLIDLEEIVNYPIPEVKDESKRKLIELLEFILLADADETPGQLEKRIAKGKILPKTSKYTRYGILQTLAECGILPNKFVPPMFDKFITFEEKVAAGKKMKGSSRSDIILPLGGWRGNLGVNLERAKEIFSV